MPPRSTRCIKRQRPGWWTQEGVLSRLQSGEYVGAICQSAVEEMEEVGITIHIRTLRADIATWTESASWGPQFTAALGMWKKTSGGAMILSKEWHDEFFQAMEAAEGNAQKAAEMSGVGYGLVLSLTDKRNKCYDPMFAERFRIAESERHAKIRERYIDTAETGKGKMATMAQQRLIESAFPSLHAPAKELQVSGKVKHDHEHDHQHTHGFAPGLAKEVVLASQDRMRRINVGRQEMLPAHAEDDRVIDVTPVRERSEVPA